MNTVTWFAFGVLIIIIFAIVSNTSATGLQNIEFQFFKMTCPYPIGQGVYNFNATFPLYDDYIEYGKDINGNDTSVLADQVGSFIECTQDPITGNLQMNVAIKEYNASCFSAFPCGFFGYVNDLLGQILVKIVAFFTFLGFFLTPINFNILGYTIADISGVGLMIVIGLYGFAYLGIGVFIGGFVVGLIRSLI